MKKTMIVATVATMNPGFSATLAHLWNFDDAGSPYADQVGSANGTGGASVTLVPGFGGGSAASFGASISSSAGYVDIDEAGISAMTGTGFSVTFRTKLADDGSNANRGFFDFSGNGGDTGLQGLYRGSDGALNFRIDGAGAPNAVIAHLGKTVENDLWHHIGLTFQAGLADGFKLYFDGALAASASTAGFSAGTGVGPNASSYLGSFNFNGTNEVKGLNGALDEFGIWSGVITAEEMAVLAIPEPSTALLSSLALLALLRRRR